MAESTLSVENFESQVHENVREGQIIRLSITQGESPKGYGIVIGSYDSAFSGTGELHKYIARELGLDRSTLMTAIVDEENYRILSIGSPSSDRVTLLCQVVSIYSNANIAEKLGKALEALFHNLRDIKRERPFPIESTFQNMWIPTLGTGSAGLSQIASAGVISTALLNMNNFHGADNLVTNITIAPPGSIDDENYQRIVEEFKLNAPNTFEVVDQNAVSEMPDQFHSDHALEDPSNDNLGRDAIAATIAKNVTRVWADQKKESRPFVIHLSGRWGAGKSSVLGFLEKRLVKDLEYHPDGWVVVNYNAWRMQNAGPAWWSLLTAVREQGYSALGGKGLWPRIADWFWRSTRIAWPWIVTLLIIAFLIWLYPHISNSDPTTKSVTTTETGVDSNGVNSTKKTIVSSSPQNSFFSSKNSGAFVLTMVAALGSIGALAKLIQSWGKSASETAEAVRELQSDPTAVVKARFERVVDNIERPVAVFIDDLDRCDARFVVELLQSLQTAYSNVTVLYVIASDRDWIVSAYNQVYGGFLNDLSKPGAPLGYLFVEKIFQLSVPIPDLTHSDRMRLTQVLLGTETIPNRVTLTREERVQEIREAASSGNLDRVREIQAAALFEGQNLADEVMSAVSDPANQSYLKHKLLDYTDDFDGNPRAIKRLINALTFRQGYILTAAQDVPFDHIVRWTILTLRFPYTAELLASRPDTKIPTVASDEFPDPEVIKTILGNMESNEIELVASFG